MSVKQLQKRPENMEEVMKMWRSLFILKKVLVMFGVWISVGKLVSEGGKNPLDCVIFLHRYCGNVSVSHLSNSKGITSGVVCIFCQEQERLEKKSGCSG